MSTERARCAWFLPGVLAVVLLVLVAAAGMLIMTRAPSATAAVTAVAREEARNFFTLDHRSPDESVDRVLALATGSFKKEYASQREAIESSMRQRELVAEATVPEGGSGVVRVDGDRAEVLVAVDVRSRSTAGTQEMRYRTRISLRRERGGWLVDDLQQVG